ncbi:hypothetical protein O0L34_g13691 [Tuta absoluta]|nr:hypothetical protein O0L34_g13691 [Tuta absoluta]
MRIEVPEFKKCCCCVPLRYGILTWVYIRMVLNILNLLLIMFLSLKLYLAEFIVIALVVAFVWVLADMGFSLTFIIGAHKKNYKLLRVFYYFLLVCIGLYNLMYILIIGNEIYMFQSIKDYFTEDDPSYARFRSKFWEHIGEYVANYIVTIVATGYLALLVRSETLKLMRNCKFEFVNNAAIEEAECQLKLESEVLN